MISHNVTQAPGRSDCSIIAQVSGDSPRLHDTSYGARVITVKVEGHIPADVVNVIILSVIGITNMM